MSNARACPSLRAESADHEHKWEEPDQPPIPDQFRVHDDDSANWLIRKINECRAYAERCADWADREQRRVQHQEQFLFLRYGQQLIDYARQKIVEQGGRRKSVALPAGTMGFRSERARIVVDDEAAVIAWAKTHQPALVKTVERLSKSGLNQHIEQTGEAPDVGLRIQPEREKFYVR